MNKPVAMIEKCRGGPKYLLWQWHFSTLITAAPKRCYLIIDYSRDNPKIYLRQMKPTDEVQHNNFTEITRKYLPRAMVKDVFWQKDSQIYWLMLANQQTLWTIYFKLKPWPEVGLVNNQQETLCRISETAIFTKKTKLENGFNSDNVQSFELQISQDNVQHDPSLALDISQEQKTLLRRCRRRLKMLNKTKTTNWQHLPDQNLITDLIRQTEFLKTYGYLWDGQQEKLHYNSQEIILNPELTLGQNLQHLYLQLNKSKNAREHMGKYLAAIAQDIKVCKEVIGQLSVEKLPLAELNHIAVQLGLASVQKTARRNTDKDQITPRYFRYQGLGLSEIWVGKDAQSNDLLLKQTKGNCLCFHVIGSHGAHVVLKKGDKLSPVELTAMKKMAGIIGLFHSQKKGLYTGDVYATTRQFLKKTKDSPPGSWQILKADKMSIVFNAEELSNVLANKI